MRQNTWTFQGKNDKCTIKVGLNLSFSTVDRKVENNNNNKAKILNHNEDALSNENTQNFSLNHQRILVLKSSRDIQKKTDTKIETPEFQNKDEFLRYENVPN